MTKQEAAALLRRAAENDIEAIAAVVAAFADLADLLDPPREGLAKVQIALAWDDHGHSARSFGPDHTAMRSQSEAFKDLADWGQNGAPTIITAYVPRPARTVAQVEGEVEG